MVKALDLSSNGHISAWVRTPPLVNYNFMEFLSSYSSLFYADILFALVVSREFRCGREGNNALISSLYVPLQNYAIQIEGTVPCKLLLKNYIFLF